MRTKLLLNLALIAAVAGVATGWVAERTSATRLHARLVALRGQQDEWRTLLARRDRLHQLLAEAAARRAAEPMGVAAAFLPSSIDIPPVPGFVLGDWRSSAFWKNEGHATARATIATMLWAAAGGDLAALEDALEFDDAARGKAAELLAALPPAVRGAYATPEDLIASVTMKNIPLSAAQVSWFHESDPDHAVVGLLLAGTEPTPAEAPVDSGANGTGAPPMLANRSANKLALLSLHRSNTGWRVVVPATAVSQVARELTAPQK